MSYSGRIVGAAPPRSHPGLGRLRRASVASAVLAVMAAGLAVVVTAGPVAADTDPQPPATVPTVSADALPTAQIGQGVVWDQVVVGNTVYATGEFTTARPAGVAVGGAGEVSRSNLLAYNLSTGALLSWAPTLNGAGKSIKASADGTRIFVSGSFTTVNGVARNRIAAIDASTGQVVSGWNPNANSRVSVIAVRGNTVYMGGIFSTVGGQARTRLAAVTADTGAVLPWAPTADADVLALTAPPGSSIVVAGGRFANLNSAPWYGMGALDGTTGASQPWAIVNTVRDAGTDSAIYSLSSDGNRVYGTGYTFGGGGNFEGTFAATVSGGSLVYVTGCRGDTYDAVPVGPVLYYVGHAHDCSTIGGHPQTQPWTFQHAIAQTTAAAPSGLLNQGGNFNGQPAPELLHWAPDFTTGSYTGATQAAWTIEGNADYVVLGGEFPTVNGTAQQGLVRFAVRSIAPNKSGPRGAASSLAPTVVALAPGRMRVAWQASYDRDNRRLTYEVLRGATLGTATVVSTQAQDSIWWNRPNMFFVDSTAPAGTSQTYRIRVKDSFGNTLVGTTTTADVPAGGVAIGAMTSQALADGAKNLWPLGESSGTTAYDYASADDLTLASSATRGTAGPNSGDPTTATTFPGTAAVPAVTSAIAPAPGSFAAEVWFKTTTTSGGKLLGYGNSRTGDSSNYDRHLYMTNNGRLIFGVYPGGVQTVMTGTAYNDGVWHHAVVNLGATTGMELYVDGKRADAKPAVTTAQAFSGYWRVGGDNLNGWTNQPSSSKFAGSLQNVAIYPAPLTAAQVLQHYQVGTGTGTPNQAPVAAFTSTVSNLTVTVDGSGSSDADGTVASYAWAFGDGATATGAKPAPHTYANAGDYAVTLTVTDNGGATNTVTRTVTATAPNQAPVAAFTSTVSNLTLTVDGSGSSDADGTVASYAWAFGDGATATGAKPAPHTYANAGDYGVTLTVTDNGGATNTLTRTITATAPNQPLAQDTFTRTVTTGFGTADTGGAWTFAGTGTTASVAGGSGAVSVTAGKTARLTLAGVSSLNTEVTHTLWTEAMPTGGGAYLATVVRGTSAGSYRARVKILSTGVVTVQFFTLVGTTETAVGSAATVPGLTYTPGTKLAVTVRATGGSPTTLQAKVWVAGQTEPASWSVSATDSTAGLQEAGSVGFSPYLSGSATAALVIRYDDLVVTKTA